MPIFTFKRRELKYRITKKQYEDFLIFLSQYMKEDKYGKYTIQSLYFDTDTNLLIRRSIEKPTYKEKIRLRSYGLADENKLVFLELKKKYDKTVFKRRISISQKDCFDWLNKKDNDSTAQINKEINYFINYYESLKPKMLLIYDRQAFAINDSDLRITFDTNVRYRNYDLTLDKGFYGTQLIDNNEVLMEIKSSTAFPLWLVRKLSQEKIYKTSFSKYGTAYKILLQNKEISYV